MKSNLFLQVISVVIILLYADVCSAASLSPAQAEIWAQNKGNLLLDTFHNPDINQRVRLLDQMFLDYVDIDYVSKFMVGKYWRLMTASQQQTYRKLFVEYVLALYKTFPLDFASSVTYKIGKANSEGEFTIIPIVAEFTLNPHNPPKKMNLQFRLHQHQGQPKLVDIKIAESSLILSYRGKFYGMMAAVDNEIDWFLDDFKALISSLKQNSLIKPVTD